MWSRRRFIESVAALPMLAALELFVAKDHAKEAREFERRAESIRNSARAVRGVTAGIFVPEVANHVPHVRVSWDRNAVDLTAAGVVATLQAGEPSIVTRSEGEALVVSVGDATTPRSRRAHWAVVDEAEVSPASTSSTICDQLVSQVSTLAAELYVRLV